MLQDRFPIPILCTLFLLCCANGCVSVDTQKNTVQTPGTLIITPKPEITMSEEFIRTPAGDVIAFLPEGWFTIDAGQNLSENVAAVAVNPDYSLSMVVSGVRTSDSEDRSVYKEGLIGLARIALEHRQRKTSSSVKLIGKLTPVAVGTKNFVTYECERVVLTSGSTSATMLCAVFSTATGSTYEIALVPTDVTLKSPPSQREIMSIFRSVLATIQF